MIILYFNQWFNTIRKHFEYLREDFGNEIKIIGSGKPDNLYKDCCDEFYVEPKFEHMVDQLNWWVDLCKEKNVALKSPPARRGAEGRFGFPGGRRG